MSNEIFEQLSDLTHAQYSADLARLQKLNQAEDRIVQDLANLEQSRKRNSAALKAETNVQKSLGGDVLWQAWLSRATRSKQMEIAKIRAQKDHVMQGLRRSFGRHTAAQNLAKTSALARKQECNEKLQRAQENLRMLSWANDRDEPL